MLFIFPSLAKKPVGSPPEFTQPLKTEEVVEGVTVKLTCSLKGVPQPTIRWLKDGEPVKTSKLLKETFEGDVATLVFSKVELDDEGDYECVAENEFGSASCSAELLVNEADSKPEFSKTMKDVEVELDSVGRFDVQVSGVPMPTVEWFKGTEKIENEGKFSLIHEEEGLFSLVVDQVSTDDGATYTCKATNDLGEVSCEAELRLEPMIAPEFVDDVESGPINAEEGADVELVAVVKGKPTPDVEWYKDEKPLRKTSRFDTRTRGDTFSLVILNVTPDDSGLYKCLAKSKRGNATKTFEVNVEGMFHRLFIP